ncbi:MAG TPA: hypothetical protein VHP37_20150 [Burkholderiales bacterium]|nr:hypothetical protein [Burkholderiales bacterium]
MADWHFFQGVRDEWRWYCVDDLGGVVREGVHDHAELARCMDDARNYGFRDSEFSVHARSQLAQFPRRRQTPAGGPMERRRAAKSRPHAEERRRARRETKGRT